MNILYKSKNIKIGKNLIFAIAFPNKVPSFNFEVDLTFPNSYKDTEGGHFSFNLKFPYIIDFRFSVHRKA